jgi:hypothetical protein
MAPQHRSVRLIVMRLFLLPAALLLAAFSFVPPHKDLAAPTPIFDAEKFFVGKTEGKGHVRAALASRSTVHDIAIGRIEQGVLILEQKVQRQGKPVELRRWRMRKLATGKYTGTISDVEGPVHGEVSGNCMHLRYKMKKGGVQVEQYVYLQPGGRSAISRMTFRKFGITVATVEETIRKIA